MTTLAQYTKMLRDFEAGHPVTQAPNPSPWDMAGGSGSDVIRGANAGEYTASQQYQDFLNSLPDKGAEYTQLDNARYAAAQKAARIKFVALVATLGVAGALAAMPEMAGALEAGSAAGGAGDAGAGLGWMGGADATGVGTMGDAIAGGAGSATSSIGGGSLFDQGVDYSKALDTANALRGGSGAVEQLPQQVIKGSALPPELPADAGQWGPNFPPPTVDQGFVPAPEGLVGPNFPPPTIDQGFTPPTSTPTIPPGTQSAIDALKKTAPGTDWTKLLGGAALGAGALAALDMPKVAQPSLPDFKSLAEQTAASQQAATDTQTTANRPNQTNAQGDTLTWVKDPATGQWTQKVAYSGANQAKSDQTNAMLSALRGNFQSGIGQPLAAPAMSPIDTAKLQQINLAGVQPAGYKPMGKLFGS